jgi:carbon monoxide dehydrogenase subunit G
MATVSRTRALAAPPEAVWRTVGDLHQLARWWPKVLRVEAVRDGCFTEVLRTERGRDVRADFILAASDPPRSWAADQTVEGTPFEGVLAAARKSVQLQPAGAQGTLVTVTLERRMRGMARLGGFMMRTATRRQVDAALDNLEDLHGALAT